mmetsp:Transcript_119744/g.298699  ORF Transcript_119744/g.298699 Transcript_119744/m.298699 type:complete len:226 (-) Transcript_119744:67-744(-)|eukprot:CAMPEP_0115400310 /NCGR_PEP_ID=MMETSP0271-20121206/15292_1 /TAXON_ID=71861 /ORGANISM="Scrippsiella trochoidea, Strain CCMP3099" /LENGTH=225 /DNA_ID=CAMNT_0002824161 /DNA_START=74 /DNA_END=751 /DNA_ORIENTATION=-
MPFWWGREAQPPAEQTPPPIQTPAPIPVAVARLVPPSGAEAPGAAAAGVQVPRERMPEVPATFPGINTLSADVLQQLVEQGSLVLDDWVADHEAVLKITDRVKELRKENADLARDLIAKEASFAEVAQLRRSGGAALAEKQSTIEALAKRRVELLKKRAPERQAAELQARAQKADGEAEDLLQDALATGGPMDNSALAAFRQQFVQQKMEKHWRMALKESVAQKA